MSSDRLMATSFRFEINKGSVNSRKHSQEQRIAALEDEMFELSQMNQKGKEIYKTTWNNNFDSINEMHRSNNKAKFVQGELKVIKKANILVRRDALKKLFYQEYQLYESELKSRGLCIHKERI